MEKRVTSEVEDQTQGKKTYEKPLLVSRGDVATLTQAGFNAGSDSKATGELVQSS
ncbi:lasso RiPP family leader peptide-containing protein [Sulfidibacter corallicola]